MLDLSYMIQDMTERNIKEPILIQWSISVELTKEEALIDTTR